MSSTGTATPFPAFGRSRRSVPGSGPRAGPGILPPTLRAQLSQQPLVENPQHTRSELVGLDAHVDQPQQSRRGVLDAAFGAAACLAVLVLLRIGIFSSMKEIEDDGRIGAFPAHPLVDYSIII